MFLYEHPILPIYCHPWDWKGQPNWRAITVAMQMLGRVTTPIIYEVETQSDEHAVLIAPAALSPEQAQKFYNEMWNGVDWKEIEE